MVESFLTSWWQKCSACAQITITANSEQTSGSYFRLLHTASAELRNNTFTLSLHKSFLNVWNIKHCFTVAEERNGNSSWSISHICYTHMCTALHHSLAPRGLGPLLGERRPGQKESKAQIASEKEEPDREPGLAELPCPGRPESVWALGGWIDTRLWDLKEERPAGALTEWYCELTDWLTPQWSGDAGRRGGLFLGPHRAPSVPRHCWKWVRQTQERSGGPSESVRSAESQDKEASKQWGLCTASRKRQGQKVDVVLWNLPVQRWLSVWQSSTCDCKVFS